MSATDERLAELERSRGLAGEFIGHLRHVRRLSEHTVRAYETDLDAYMDWCARQGVSPISPSRRSMRRYLTYLVSAGYADKTVNRHLSTLRTFFTWLLEHGGEVDDTVLSMHGRKLPKVLPKVMADEDVDLLLEACDVTTPEGLRDRAMIDLMYATGARISEMARLGMGDLDFDEGQARLFGKGSKERIVPVYGSALESVRRYVLDARPSLVARRKKEGSATTLFVSARGNDMTADALRARFERLVRLAGLEDAVTPHAMRHTYATELLSGGADLRTVQELLGHESMATTQIYTHLSVDRLKAATKLAHPRG